MARLHKIFGTTNKPEGRMMTPYKVGLRAPVDEFLNACRNTPHDGGYGVSTHDELLFGARDAMREGRCENIKALFAAQPDMAGHFLTAIILDISADEADTVMKNMTAADRQAAVNHALCLVSGYVSDKAPAAIQKLVDLGADVNAESGRPLIRAAFGARHDNVTVLRRCDANFTQAIATAEKDMLGQKLDSATVERLRHYARFAASKNTNGSAFKK